MKRWSLLLALIAGGAAFSAVPPEVSRLADEMYEAQAQVRAGSSAKLGVFVVGYASASIKESPAKARNAAQALARESIASFLSTKVASETEVSAKEANGDVEEFYSSLTKTSVKELLKGIQDLKSFQDGDEMVCFVYMTTKGIDKTDELIAAKNAMGEEGTVRGVGEAANRDAALQKALRSSVEQVLGTLVVGETAVKDLEKVKSRIFSGAQGLVDEYRIVEEVNVTIGVRVTVIAKVSKKKLLDSYSTYMKALGDPVFYIASNSPDLSSHFAEFFIDMGIRIGKRREGSDYTIECFGDFRNVRNPMNGRKGTQLSLRFKVVDNKTSEALVDMKNDPSKSACFQTGGIDRQRELCADRAFAQMKNPLHEKIHAMVSTLMDRHTDAMMNSDE